MREFTDTSGKTWAVEVNVHAIRMVRDLLKIDLMEFAGGDLGRRLAVDPVLLCAVLFVICRDQAAKAGVSEEDFGRAMGGDAWDAAVRALVEELVNFSRNPQDRENLRKILALNESAAARVRQQVTARLENGELEAAIVASLDRELQRLLGSASGSVPESSESNPAGSPSESSPPCATPASAPPGTVPPT